MTRQLTITGLGDIMLDQRLRLPRVFYHLPDVSIAPGVPPPLVAIPFVNSEASLRWLRSLGRSAADVLTTSHAFRCVAEPAHAGAEGDVDRPFAAIRELLAGSDVVVANLEAPLTTRARRYNNDMCYSASPDYAAAMKRAGIDVVSLANNHCFDYGEEGFIDTLSALRAANVGVIGAGATLETARAPLIIAECGYRVAFLAYSMVGAPHLFATAEESGIAPFNPFVVAEDVAGARSMADLVVLSVHWGNENEGSPSPRLVELAHDCIDVGADVVFGHHPHVPGALELYKSRPIFYSLGNFVFGHSHKEWHSNIAASICFRDNSLASIRITPLAGHFQPAVATGDFAGQCIQRLQDVSRSFGTKLTADEGSAVVELR